MGSIGVVQAIIQETQVWSHLPKQKKRLQKFSYVSHRNSHAIEETVVSDLYFIKKINSKR